MENQVVKTISNGILTVFHQIGVVEEYNIKGMATPVGCTYCASVYDLQKVKSIHRFADCDTFRSPCCKRMVDTREWKTIRDFTRIDLTGAEVIN